MLNGLETLDFECSAGGWAVSGIGLWEDILTDEDLLDEDGALICKEIIDCRDQALPKVSNAAVVNMRSVNTSMGVVMMYIIQLYDIIK